MDLHPRTQQLENTIEKYLIASEEYIRDKKKRHVDFEFPDIKAGCPICRKKGCAIWKGYYLRWFSCPIMNFYGQLAMRVYYCKSKKKYSSHTPDFIVPYKLLSKKFYIECTKDWIRGKKVKNIMDEFLSGLEDCFQLGISTLYSCFSFMVSRLGTTSSIRCLHDLRKLENLKEEELEKIITTAFESHKLPGPSPPKE